MQKAKNRGRPRQCRSRRCHIKERKAPDKLFFADEDEANPPREPQQSTTQAMLYFGSCQDQQEITVHMQSPARDQAMRRRQIAGLGVEEGGQIKGKRDHISASEPTPHVHDRSRSMRIAAAPHHGARRHHHHHHHRAGPRPGTHEARPTRTVATHEIAPRAELDRPIPPNQQPSTCPPILALNARDSAGPPKRGKKKTRRPPPGTGRHGAARPDTTQRPSPDAKPLPWPPCRP